MPNRQIGTSSSIEELLLSDISKQLDRLIQVAAGGGGGAGTVTSVSVVSANGFAGSVATATTTPAITISTTVTGILKGDGTAVSAAVAGTDYVTPSQAWLSASGTTLTGNNTIVQAGFNTTFTGTGTVTFSPSATLAGINVGSLAGDPSAPQNGDFWYNSSNSRMFARIGGTSGVLPFITSILAARVPFLTGTSGQLTSSGNFTFVTNRILGTTLYLTLSAGTATAGTCPLLMTSGTNLTVAISGGIEYNNTFHMTNSDATRRHVVLAPNTTKVTAGAPYTNDGYVVLNIGGTDFKMMTTA